MIETLKNFEENQTNYINNHNKQINEQEEKTIINFLDNLINENNLGMCVPLKNLKEIIESDKIKNQLELNIEIHGTTESRKESIKYLFGVTENIKEEDYPKFGFILDKDPLRHMLTDTNIFYQYGNIILILKKENLINRTTMTLGSSLDFKAYLNKVPMKLTNPNIYCIEEQHQKYFYELINNGKLTTKLPGRMSKVLEEKGIVISNYELQYHGEITFSKDIEKVCLLPIKETDKEEFNKITPLLDKLNIGHEILELTW